MIQQTIDHTVGDTLHPLQLTITDEAEQPVDLTGSTVKFRMRDRITGVDKIANGSCTILSAVNGLVKYEWQAADVNTVSEYDAWFVEIQDGDEQHYPESGPKLRIDMKDAP